MDDSDYIHDKENISTVEVYSHERHYRLLENWLCAYGLQIPHPSLFSDIGFVVDGIAIGFLFPTPSKQAYMDHVATDPYSNPRDRNLALNALFKNIETEATKRGFWMITALAKLPVMKQRFLHHQYEPYGDYTLFYRTLLEGVAACPG